MTLENRYISYFKKSHNLQISRKGRFEDVENVQE